MKAELTSLVTSRSGSPSITSWKALPGSDGCRPQPGSIGVVAHEDDRPAVLAPVGEQAPDVGLAVGVVARAPRRVVEGLLDVDEDEGGAVGGEHGWTVCSGSLVSGKLETYRAKRSAQKTPEPMGEAGGAAATAGASSSRSTTPRRLHWDLRLEHDGVARLVGVPNGHARRRPSDNRLAVHTEDHPLEYLEFEGEIPQGQYGAGTMTIWDRGTYEVREVGDAQGRGRASTASACTGATRSSRSPDDEPKDWMIHRMDPPADAGRRADARADRADAGARSARCRATTSGWAFEVKWDGVRAIATREPGRLRLQSRNLQRHHARAIPRCARLNRALSHAPRGARRRDRRLRRRRPAELRARCSSGCTSARETRGPPAGRRARRSPT